MKTVKRPINKKYIIAGSVLLVVLAALLAGAFLLGGEKSGTISEDLRDAVLHEDKKISLFGWEVNPSVISGIIVTAVLLVFALCVRIFAIPRFKEVPGKFQSVIEAIVSFFDGTARSNSPHRSSFIGCYIFAAGCYIFVGTIFELFGIQAVSASGESVSLPAPLSDINAAIALGCSSYLVILFGGLFTNGLRGLGRALKDFSLPISMSFRLFGALLSGMLVTELVYYYVALSVVLPVIVGVLFTLLHALIQTYVLITLTSTYFGEAAEPVVHKPKRENPKKRSARKSDVRPAEKAA